MQTLTAEWMENISKPDSFRFYFTRYLLINLLNIVFLLGAFFLIRVWCLLISNVFFKKMATKVFRAPVNLYFDVTPSGWILNRFSKDISCTDNEFSWSIFNTLDCAGSLVFTMYVTSLTSAWILISVPVVSIILYIYTKYYISCYRDLVRMDTAYNSPVLTHFGETLSGASTIRAYKK